VPQFDTPQMALLVNRLVAVLHEPIGIREYLLWSTAAIPLMFLMVAHAGADIMLGYPFILLNSAALLFLNQLQVHRNHLVAIAALGAFSLVSGHFAGTPVNAPFSQIVGISVISIYFLSALATLGPSVQRWMDMYARIAFGVACFGIVKWPIERLLHIGYDGRLTSFYAEPSNFVYTTLPALGYFINCYVQERRYGPEAAIFILSYLLADSSLGFLGLVLIGILTFGRRLKGWHALVGMAAIGAVLAGLFFGSANVRLRVQDMALALSTQDVSKANGTTFALLSNLYVATKVFLDHPLTGVGLGGYSYVYDNYIFDLTGIKSTYSGNIDLNKADANSLFLRTAAELGIPGLAALFGFLIACARVKGRSYERIRNALLPYLIVRMWRYGAYFSVELYFFAGLYLLNYLGYRRAVTAKPPAAVGGRAALVSDSPLAH